ncbi:MAG TPA: hypothetical protein VMW52_06515, partial [Phycisphaerae bacterium]|nr:hypothetical protein [Phycisphaerae bacterium]
HQDLEAENPILLVGRQEVGIPEPPSWPMMRFMERAAATQEAVAAAEAAPEADKARIDELKTNLKGDLKEGMGETGAATAPGAQRGGIRLQTLADACELGYLYIKQGARTFRAWAKQMVGALGDAVRPFLQSVWRGAVALHQNETGALGKQPRERRLRFKTEPAPAPTAEELAAQAAAQAADTGPLKVPKGLFIAEEPGAQQIAEAKQSVIAELPEPGITPAGELDMPKVGLWARGRRMAATNLRLAARRLGESAERVIDQPVRRGIDRKIQAVEEMGDDIRVILKKHGVDPATISAMTEMLRGKTDEVTTRLPNGTTVRLAPARRIGFDLLARQPDAHKALKSNRGWITARRRAVGGYQPVFFKKQLTDADIDAVRNSLTPQERQVAEAIHEVFNTTYRNHLNEVSQRLWGTDIATREDYFPVRRHFHDVQRVLPLETEQAQLPDEAGFGRKDFEGWSALKERTGGMARIEVPDAFVVLGQHLQRIAALDGLGGAVRQVEALLTDPDLRERIDAAEGQGAADQMLRMARRAWSREQRLGEFDKGLAKLRGKTAGAILALRISTWVAQTLSYPLAMNEMSPGESAKYLSLNRPLTADERARSQRVISKDYALTLWRRVEHGYIGREIGDFLHGHEMEYLLTGKRPLTEIQTMGMRKFDSYVIRRIALVAFGRAQAELGADADEGQVLQRAGEIAEEITSWTQPTWTAADRTMLGGTESEVIKLVTMFRAFRDKVLIQVHKSVVDYRKSGRAPADATKLALRLGNALFVSAMLNWARLKLWRLARRKEKPEDVTWA